MSRPQDKNLIPLTERSEEEAHAIRSAGGKASQEKRRERQMMADLLELYSGLPITDKRKQNRLKKLGIPSEVLTQKMLVADALMRSRRRATPMRSSSIWTSPAKPAWAAAQRTTICLKLSRMPQRRT